MKANMHSAARVATRKASKVSWLRCSSPNNTSEKIPHKHRIRPKTPKTSLPLCQALSCSSQRCSPTVQNGAEWTSLVHLDHSLPLLGQGWLQCRYQPHIRVLWLLQSLQSVSTSSVCISVWFSIRSCHVHISLTSIMCFRVSYSFLALAFPLTWFKYLFFPLSTGSQKRLTSVAR